MRVEVTIENIRDAYDYLYDDKMTPEQLEWVEQELEGRVNNFIDQLLENLLSEIRSDNQILKESVR